MFLDIHVHTRRIPGPPRANGQTYATPAQLIERYDAIGVEKAELLVRVARDRASDVANSLFQEIKEHLPAGTVRLDLPDRRNSKRRKDGWSLTLPVTWLYCLMKP